MTSVQVHKAIVLDAQDCEDSCDDSYDGCLLSEPLAMRTVLIKHSFIVHARALVYDPAAHFYSYYVETRSA